MDEMIKSRNLSSHTYNEEVADALKDKILEVYYSLFKKFSSKMNTLIQK